jgi:pyridoxine 5-phosphate synthase
VACAARLEAEVIELHTGTYGEVARGDEQGRELKRLRDAAEEGLAAGLVVNAGHGLTLENVGPIAAIPGMNELNIGHSIIADAVFHGLEEAVRRMKRCIRAATEGR